MKGNRTQRRLIVGGVIATAVLAVGAIVGVAVAWQQRAGAEWSDNTPIDRSAVPVSRSGGADPTRRIHVAVAAVGSIEPPTTFLRFRGEVRARRESRLALRRNGRLQSVAVHEGDFVAEGDVLARLDVSDLDVAQRIAKAEFEAATARLQQAEAGPRYQTVLAAEAQVRELQAQLASAKEQLRREQALDRRGAGSQQSLDTARFDVQRLEAVVAQATSRLEELREGTRTEQIQIARAELAAAEAALEKIAVDRNDSRLVAPFDAVVAQRTVDEGTMVGPDSPVLRLLEVPPVEARFGIPAEAAASLAVGQQVRVRVGFQRPSETAPQPSPVHASDTGGDNVGHWGETTRTGAAASGTPAAFHIGQVVRMQPQLDPVTRTRGVDVRLPASSSSPSDQNAEMALVGQPAALWLPEEGATDDARDAFWVPSAALVRGARGLWSVYVAAESDRGTASASAPEKPKRGAQPAVPPVQKPIEAVIRRRDVRLVRTAGRLSLVRGMIRRGEWMVIDGVHRIGPGVAVIAVRGSDERLVEGSPRWASAKHPAPAEQGGDPTKGQP